MYEAHFGLTELPFPTAQDPRAYVDTTLHRAAVLALLAGFERNDEFMLLTGEFGVGKTTVVRRMLAQVDPERHRVVELTSLRIAGDELFDRVAEALGGSAVDPGDGPRVLSRLLEGLAAAGQDALVLVDDAQRLDIEALDSLRELAGTRIEGRGVLHVCLIGRTAPPGIEVLRQAGRPLIVGTTCDVGLLDAAGTRDYVLAQLTRVGWTGRPSFDPDAFAEIHARCGGIPAHVNRLCGHILLQLYLLHRDAVTAEVVRAVDDLLQSELDGEPSTLDLPPSDDRVPAPEAASVQAAQALPGRPPAAGARATLSGLAAPRADRGQRRWIRAAAAAAVLLSGGIAWYMMSGHASRGAEEARLAVSRVTAASAMRHDAVPIAPIAPEPTPALAAPLAGSLAAVSATPVPAAVATRRLPGRVVEEGHSSRRVRPEGSRTTRTTTATAAACSLEAEALGLCSAPRVPTPAREAAREPAVDAPSGAPPASPARPACESTRAALGLCPEHATAASPPLPSP